jgi:hypothetical protein
LSQDDESKRQLAEAQRSAFEAGMARVSSLNTKAILVVVSADGVEATGAAG